MACFRPVKGIITATNGKRKFIPTDRPRLDSDVKLTVPCGRCIGCREGHSKMWAIRCVNEMAMHKEACFITLTYNPLHAPPDGSLDKEDLSYFIRKLRFHLKNKKIRYFACGEYGDKFSRPHFHILLFGHQFDDREHYKGDLYTSPTLEKIWKKGFCPIGTANFQTAAYISRYVTKKITGSQADKHYQTVDLETGEITPILGEYATMSNRPGIGYEWYQQFKNDVFPSDEIICDGRSYPVPRYYDKLLERDNPELFERIKQKRIDNFEEKDPDEFHWRRLIAKEKCKQAQIQTHLKRKYEDNTIC